MRSSREITDSLTRVINIVVREMSRGASVVQLRKNEHPFRTRECWACGGWEEIGGPWDLVKLVES